jgi:hypothetical protein
MSTSYEACGCVVRNGVVEHGCGCRAEVESLQSRVDALRAAKSSPDLELATAALLAACLDMFPAKRKHRAKKGGE